MLENPHMGFSENPPQCQMGKVRLVVPPDPRYPQKFGDARLPKDYWLLPWALAAEVSRPNGINKAVL